MGKHKNIRQEKVFLKWMEDHPIIARGFSSGDKAHSESLWANLSSSLNSEGPPVKDVTGWKKVWSDWKSNIRKKLAHNKREAKATGGGGNNVLPISAIEDGIAKLTGIYSVIDGIKGTSTFGGSFSDSAPKLNNSQKIESPVSSCDENEAQKYANMTVDFSCYIEEDLPEPEPQKTRKNVERPDKIFKYMEDQKATLKTIATDMTESIEISKENKTSLKRCYRAIEKLCDVLKEQNVEQKRYNTEALRLHAEKNEIKRKRLEIEEMKLNLEN
ncbi:uncharacterized protein LOC129946036 [Eupeodes corollae]|uniref:uncharacterized protein LOC129946036 n=1 Tax=Eupeodes corollae TaxID=290404 RepID=UPI002491FC8A|nr:uncharacterized protein LOC129946036 [Eupeodes corollae]